MMVGNHVSHSNRRVKRRFYLPEEDRWIVLKVSAAGMRTIDKKGLSVCLKEAREKGYITKY